MEEAEDSSGAGSPPSSSSSSPSKSITLNTAAEENCLDSSDSLLDQEVGMMTEMGMSDEVVTSSPRTIPHLRHYHHAAPAANLLSPTSVKPEVDQQLEWSYQQQAMPATCRHGATFTVRSGGSRCLQPGVNASTTAPLPESPPDSDPSYSPGNAITLAHNGSGVVGYQCVTEPPMFQPATPQYVTYPLPQPPPLQPSQQMSSPPSYYHHHMVMPQPGGNEGGGFGSYLPTISGFCEQDQQQMNTFVTSDYDNPCSTQSQHTSPKEVNAYASHRRRDAVVNKRSAISAAINHEDSMPDCKLFRNKDSSSRNIVKDELGENNMITFIDQVYEHSPSGEVSLPFEPFVEISWAKLSSGSEKDEGILPAFCVEADKGFHYSTQDKAFICYKKNHFQITTHIGKINSAVFAHTEFGMKKVKGFFLHFYGIKAESQTQIISIEQSQQDRKKRSFRPVHILLSTENIVKATVGRLHFADTTLHNQRKKNKPNPDQRYFRLVVALQAECEDDVTATIIASISERIIVRASNPGQFETDIEAMWHRGASNDIIYHNGNIGINTESPTEALTVNGNINVTGQIVTPSDERLKIILQPLEPHEQLDKVKRINIYRYRYTEQAGIQDDEREATGVIAQEVEQILPDAVTDRGDWLLLDGSIVPNVKVVDKDRIYMENVGATKELCKMTGNLEDRIHELERMNKRVVILRRRDSVMSSTSQIITTASNKSSSSITSSFRSSSSRVSEKKKSQKSPHHCHESPHHCHCRCSSLSHRSTRRRRSCKCHKNVRVTLAMLFLGLIMALCMIAVVVILAVQVSNTTQDSEGDDGGLADEFLAEMAETTQTARETPSVATTTHPPTTTDDTIHHLLQVTTTQSTGNLISPTETTPEVDVLPPVGDHLAIMPNCEVQGCEDYCRKCDDVSVDVYRYGIQSRGEPEDSRTTAASSLLQHHTIRPTGNIREILQSLNRSIFVYHDSNNNILGLGVERQDKSQINDGRTTSTTTAEPSNNVFGSVSDIRNDIITTRKKRGHRNRIVVQEISTLVRSIRIVDKTAPDSINNVTVDERYCRNAECQKEGSLMYNYSIPVSIKLFPKSLDLEFTLSGPVHVHLCDIKKGIMKQDNQCPLSIYKLGIRKLANPGEGPEINTDGFPTYSWTLPIGLYKESHVTFRLTENRNGTEICSASRDSNNQEFVEYNFQFYRLCTS